MSFCAAVTGASLEHPSGTPISSVAVILPSSDKKVAESKFSGRRAARRGMLAAAAAVDVAAQPSYPHYGGREVTLLDSETAWRFGYIDAFGDATRALSPQALAASAPPPPPPRRPARASARV